jgi:hypothetical protein
VRQLGDTPNPANVLHGETAAIATIITVPAGRTWRGTLVIAGAVAAAAGAAAINAIANIKVNGTGSVPTAGTNLLTLPLSTPVVAAATAGIAIAASVTLTDVVVVAPPANAVTVDFNPTAATARAVAHGVLL